MKDYKPNKIAGWFDLLLICILSWMLILLTIIWLPDIVISLMK